MVIADILRTKGSDVITVTGDLTVAQLVGLLAERRIGAVVVSADGAEVDGIVSERDVVAALASRGAEVLDARVDTIATHDVVTAEPSTRVDQLRTLMTEGRFRHVPVVVDSRLVGLVSIGDVVKASIAELASERDALESYITTSSR